MFIFISPDDFCIVTPESIAKSERTFDIKFNDFATNRKLWNIFPFIDLRKYNSIEEEIRFKSFYLSSFNIKKEDEVRKYLDDNGIIRILILNKEKLDKFTNPY